MVGASKYVNILLLFLANIGYISLYFSNQALQLTQMAQFDLWFHYFVQYTTGYGLVDFVITTTPLD